MWRDGGAMTIIKIHKCGDCQTEEYDVGRNGVASIARFEIFGQMAMMPRLKVYKEDGSTVSLDEAGMTIYEIED